MIRLNLGSGVWLRSDFVNVDIYPEAEIRGKQGMFSQAIVEDGAEYVQADIRKLPFPDDYANYVEMMDVIEHISWREIVSTLEEVRRVMKPGAKLMLSTVNMDALCLDWLKIACQAEIDMDAYFEVVQGMFGNQVAVGEYHRTPFNPRTLAAALNEAGFEKPVLYLVPRGEHSPGFGTIEYNPKSVARYEHLRAEAVK